jgi:hypothetical protein
MKAGKHTVAFWTTVVAVAVILYPLSLGPVEYLLTEDVFPDWTYSPIKVLYWPFLYGPFDNFEPLNWYLRLWRHGVNLPWSEY